MWKTFHLQPAEAAVTSSFLPSTSILQHVLNAVSCSASMLWQFTSLILGCICLKQTRTKDSAVSTSPNMAFKDLSHYSCLSLSTDLVPIWTVLFERKYINPLWMIALPVILSSDSLYSVRHNFYFHLVAGLMSRLSVWGGLQKSEFLSNSAKPPCRQT